jgi:hypothetical protein
LRNWVRLWVEDVMHISVLSRNSHEKNEGRKTENACTQNFSKETFWKNFT